MADIVSATMDGFQWEAAEAVDETDAFEGAQGDFPNMLFVPHRRSEPVVDAREFATFICMLALFSHTVISQDFASDQHVNEAMQSVSNMNCLQKMDTFEDYQQCWQEDGGIYDQLSSWMSSADTCFAEQGALGFDLREQKEAVMVGVPFLYQERDSTLDGDQGFNGSMPCTWPMDAMQASAACYTHATSRIATRDFGTQREVHVLSNQQIRGVMNGTYAGRNGDGYYGWSPRSWYSREHTVRLGVNYLIYLPGMKRFAAAHITVYFNEAGQAKLETREFATYEPLLLDTNFFTVALELAFYLTNAVYLAMELMEIWDCVCMSELLVPLGVLTDAMMLSLLEIQYFHARTSEVYDPRDPKTGAAFTFPDVDDLEQHLTERIKPEQKKIKRLLKMLTKLKRQIMEKDENISQQEKDEFIIEMEKIQLDLMEADEKLHIEQFVADTAAILQLAVMWWNKWSMDFPPNALAQLADDPGVEEDGKEAFCSINWIEVAERYIEWIETAGMAQPGHSTAGDVTPTRGNPHFKVHKLGHTGGGGESVTGSLKTIAQVPVAMASRILRAERSTKAPLTHQQKRFAELTQFVDYLQMLRDVLALHTTLVQARAIKYWNGPRVELSSTIEGSYQDMIQKYNETGKQLRKQMEDFPDEIQAGFHEPNPTKAETIKVRAQAIQRTLASCVGTCCTLGFYFPGSPMWELQRRLRECGEYQRSDSFFLSLRPRASIPGLGSGTVDYNSLQMYLDADLVSKDPRFKHTSYAGTSKGAGQSGDGQKKSKQSLTTMVNPMQQLDGDTSSGESSDDDDATQTASEKSHAESSAPVELSPQQKVDAKLIFKGCTGWRSWIPESARNRVTYDGQFVSEGDGIGECCRSNNVLYIAGLWFYHGLKIYLDDYWNRMELWLYSFFMVALYCKVQMLLAGQVLKQELIDVQSGANPTGALPTMQGNYEFYSNVYLFTIIPNAFIMWIKLFKYVDVVPQMGMLIEVLKHAGMPVLIFSTVVLIPVIGLAFAYHAAYGKYLRNYETLGSSLNTLMRMLVGDFDFVELTKSGSAMGSLVAVPLFWISTLLLVFVFLNIFVAIILGSYDSIRRENPDANNSSEFASMVIMQAKRTIHRALGSSTKGQEAPGEPHILLSQLDVIEDETFWDIFEGYFKPGGHGIDAVMKEHAAELGGTRVEGAIVGSSSNGADSFSAGNGALRGQGATDKAIEELNKTISVMREEQQVQARSIEAILQSQQQLAGLVRQLAGSSRSSGSTASD